MSIRVMTVVWDLPLEPTQKLLLLAIADHADDVGMNAYPSVERLAVRCSVSERTVQRALRELERSGWIEVQRKATRYQPTCYRVDLSGGKGGDRATPDPGGRGDNLSPLDASGVTPEAGRGDTGVASGVTPVSPEPSLNRPKNQEGAAAPAPDKLAGDTPVEPFELGGFVDDYGEITGGILPVGMSARPLRDVARLYGQAAARAGWRAYCAQRHRDQRPIKAAWFAEEAGKWCKRSAAPPPRSAPQSARHPLFGWVRKYTPERRNDPDSGYRRWACPECEAKRLVPTVRDDCGRVVPPPRGSVHVAWHEAWDPALVGKCPVELGYEIDDVGRVTAVAEVRRAK